MCLASLHVARTLNSAGQLAIQTRHSGVFRATMLRFGRAWDDDGVDVDVRSLLRCSFGAVRQCTVCSVYEGRRNFEAQCLLQCTLALARLLKATIRFSKIVKEL